MLASNLNAALPSHPQTHIQYPRVSLKTNQYRVCFPEFQKVYLYTVSFFPPIPPDNSVLKKQIIREIRPELSRILGFFIHNGENLYSLRDLCQEFTKSSDDESSSSMDYVKINYSSNEFCCEVSICPSGCVEFSDASKVSSIMQVFNISLRNKLRLLKLCQIGSMRNHYNSQLSHKIRDFPACLWSGYFTSINVLRSGPMLTIDTSFKLLRTDSLLTQIEDLSKKHKNSREMIRKELENSIIITNYGSQYTYRIDRVLFDECPNNKFFYGSNEISYIQYFRDKYQVHIKNKSQPLLLARRSFKSGQIKLIPELCRMTGTGSVPDNFNLKKEISSYTRMKPDRKMREIQELANRLNGVCDGQWGITNEVSPVQVEAYQLPHPVIQTGSKSIKITEKSSFQLRETTAVKSVPLEKWQILYLEKDQGLCLDFIKSLKSLSSSFSQKIQDPLHIPVPYSKDPILNFCSLITEKVRPEAQLIVILLPKSLQYGYKSIKTSLTTEKPIPSQVVLTSSVERGDLSVYSKILIQILCKIGGTPWTVNLPQSIPKYTMLVGIDVCHNSFTAKESVLGFCASLNSQFTKFYSKAAIHAVGQEISTVLTPIFLESLKQFYTENGKRKPDCIILYRDGVGTSQYNEVVSKEIPQLVEAVKAFDKSWVPSIVAVVVNKRVNQRFFLGTQNPGPGLVVDSEVVWDHYNFYLTSHAVTMGCMTPTHYNIVVNESTISNQTLYELTYNLCYLYFNWQGGIRVPSPCMYAHKIAYLVGKHTGSLFHPKLNKSLFYL